MVLLTHSLAVSPARSTIIRYTVGLPQNELVTVASLVTHWLCYFNSAINPIIYNIMNSEYYYY